MPLYSSELSNELSQKCDISETIHSKLLNIYNCGTPGKTLHGFWMSPQIDPALKIDKFGKLISTPGEKSILDKIIEKTIQKGTNAFVCVEEYLPDTSILAEKSIKSGHYLYFSWPIDSRDNSYSAGDEFRIIITNLFFAFVGGMFDYKNGVNELDDEGHYRLEKFNVKKGVD